jgi:hypothetical protein
MWLDMGQPGFVAEIARTGDVNDRFLRVSDRKSPPACSL